MVPGVRGQRAKATRISDSNLKMEDELWGRTKQPILNETKPPILKMRQNRRFCKRKQTAFKIVSLIKASWHNYR